MVLSLREAISGCKHIGVGLKRTLARRPDTFFVADFAARGMKAERYSKLNGTPAICPICGYAMLRLELQSGWVLDTCSAMPSVTALESEEFAKWAASLSSAKLPTARV